GKSQLVLQGQAQLLMVGQPPVFPDRTTPMPVGAILPMDHHELNYPNLSLHLHRPVAPMHHLASAQGEKRRHDGRLLPAIVVGVSVASIPALRPLLPSQSHAMVGDLRAQYSSVSFGCGFSFYRMRNRSPLHYGGSVKMRPMQHVIRLWACFYCALFDSFVHGKTRPARECFKCKISQSRARVRTCR